MGKSGGVMKMGLVRASGLFCLIIAAMYLAWIIHVPDVFGVGDYMVKPDSAGRVPALLVGLAAYCEAMRHALPVMIAAMLFAACYECVKEPGK